MAQFRPPSFVKPIEYGDYGRGIEGIFDAYIASKRDAQQQNRLTQQDAIAAEGRANAEKDRQGSNLLQYGFDPRAVTPEVLARSQPGMAPQGPAQPGMVGPEQAENPLFGAVRSFLEKKKSAASMATQEQEAGIAGTQAATRLKGAQADALAGGQHGGAFAGGAEPIPGSPFFRDPASGMVLRVKPGHKGNEFVPLPGQSIGSDGRVAYTSDRGMDGKMLPPATVLGLNEGKAVARILPEVEQAIKENESIFGPVEGRARGANPYDRNAQTIDARMRTASQAFGRFMEGGVLRKEDEDKYRRMFPQLSDEKQVAKNKLSIVRRQLAQKYQDDKSALGGSGYDISGFGDLEIPPSLFGEPAPSGNSAPSGGIALSGAKAARLAELRAKAGR